MPQLCTYIGPLAPVEPEIVVDATKHSSAKQLNDLCFISNGEIYVFDDGAQHWYCGKLQG